jgi:hypothetical protein
MELCYISFHLLLIYLRLLGVRFVFCSVTAELLNIIPFQKQQQSGTKQANSFSLTSYMEKIL